MNLQEVTNTQLNYRRALPSKYPSKYQHISELILHASWEKKIKEGGRRQYKILLISN